MNFNVLTHFLLIFQSFFGKNCRRPLKEDFFCLHEILELSELARVGILLFTSNFLVALQVFACKIHKFVKWEKSGKFEIKRIKGCKVNSAG
jgi:hypothetical protein